MLNIKRNFGRVCVRVCFTPPLFTLLQRIAGLLFHPFAVTRQRCVKAQLFALGFFVKGEPPGDSAPLYSPYQLRGKTTCKNLEGRFYVTNLTSLSSVPLKN